MTESELCPEATEKIHAMIDSHRHSTVKVKTSKLYKCPNCSARYCTYRTVQIRAADEGDSVKCTCLKCNHNYDAHI